MRKYILRGYTVHATALALQVDEKWVDNLLSHNVIPGIARSTRGVRRRLPERSILIIAIARLLNSELLIPVHRAVSIARSIVETGSEFTPAPSIALRVDLDTLATDLKSRLDQAAEFAPLPKRGRPPRIRRPAGD